MVNHWNRENERDTTTEQKNMGAKYKYKRKCATKFSDRYRQCCIYVSSSVSVAQIKLIRPNLSWQDVKFKTQELGLQILTIHLTINR